MNKEERSAELRLKEKQLATQNQPSSILDVEVYVDDTLQLGKRIGEIVINMRLFEEKLIQM